MKIGFLGNANNYPFMLALALKRMGHTILFVIDSTSALNRPENRYKDIAQPYPDWIVDCSPLDLWAYPDETGPVDKAINLLKTCDAVVLNEFGVSLAGRIQRPVFAVLTGTDLEILANKEYADFVTGYAMPRESLWRRLRNWRQNRSRRIQKAHMLKLIDRQREGIRQVVALNYFPQGLLPQADAILAELGIGADRRSSFLMAEANRYPYSPYPSNSVLRVFNVARIQWRKPRDYFICELDYKGTDILIKGLGLFVRKSTVPIEIRLARKGVDLEITRQLIMEEGIAGSVVWLDELDQISLYDEYANADIIFEHFGKGSIGMGAVDAMAVGRPVIANGNPALFRETLGEETPICHATEPWEICAQLERLAQDSALREKIGVTSRAYVEKYFTSDRAAKIVIDKLENAIQ